MNIEDIGKVLSSTVTTALDRLNEYQEEQRDRWFKPVGDGVRREVYEPHIISEDSEVSLPKSGLEYPSILVVDEMKVKLDTDLHVQQLKGVKKLLAGFFHGKDQHSTLKVEIKVVHQPPPEGLLALHKRAGREVKEACMLINPDMYKTEDGNINIKTEKE